MTGHPIIDAIDGLKQAFLLKGVEPDFNIEMDVKTYGAFMAEVATFPTLLRFTVDATGTACRIHGVLVELRVVDP